MATYELVFELPPIDEKQEDAIYDRFDALISSHAGSVLLTVSADGPTCGSVVQAVVHWLQRHDITPRRLYEDLVTRGEIAERADVTPQAVGNWVRADRRESRPFPEPYNHAAGGLWLWAEVNEWLRHLRKDDGMEHPNRRDYARVNSWLYERWGNWRAVSTSSPSVRWRDEPRLVLVEALTQTAAVGTRRSLPLEYDAKDFELASGQ